MDKKKILTVLPVRTSTANLREDLFATIINYYGYDYQLMMLTSWGFRLYDDDSNKKLSQLVNLEKDYLDIGVAKHFGLKFDKKFPKSEQEIIECVKRNIDNEKPLILHISTYILPYHRTFNDENNSHSHEVLIIGYDETSVYYIDVSWGTDIKKISLNLMKDHIQYLEQIASEKFNISFRIIDMLSLVIEKVTRIDKYGDMFSAIIRFADLVENKFDIYVENNQQTFNAESLRFNPFIFNIDNIGRLRLGMSDACQYIYDKYHWPDFLDISREFSLVAQEWIRLRYILIKGCCLGGKKLNEAKRNAANRMKMVSSHEKNILMQLIKIRNNLEEDNINKQIIVDSSNDEISEVYFLDLSNKFNICTFHNSKNRLNANFKISEIEYYLSDHLEKRKYINVGNMKFMMPNVYDELEDAIYCQGQIIDVHPEMYRYIQIMGFSVYKGYAGEIEIVHEDGIEKVEFAISNSGSKPLYGEKIALHTEFMSKGMIREGAVFCNEYALTMPGRILKIKLPEWDMFNIMAISLRK